MMRCNKCNNEMKRYIEGSSLILRCPNCGYSVATTYMDPINADETIYSVIVNGKNEISIDNVKLISQIMNSNYITARNSLIAGPFKVSEGRATSILSVKKQLDDRGINYVITPEFKY